MPGWETELAATQRAAVPGTAAVLTRNRFNSEALAIASSIHCKDKVVLTRAEIIPFRHPLSNKEIP
jgi:hypothetical protein